MRHYHIESKMSRSPTAKRDSTRTWLSGLAVILTTIVAYLAFWRLAPGTVFVIGCLALVAMVIAAWIAGGPSRQSRE